MTDFDNNNNPNFNQNQNFGNQFNNASQNPNEPVQANNSGANNWQNPSMPSGVNNPNFNQTQPQQSPYGQSVTQAPQYPNTQYGVNQGYNPANQRQTNIPGNQLGTNPNYNYANNPQSPTPNSNPYLNNYQVPNNGGKKSGPNGGLIAAIVLGLLILLLAGYFVTKKLMNKGDKSSSQKSSSNIIGTTEESDKTTAETTEETTEPSTEETTEQSTKETTETSTETSTSAELVKGQLNDEQIKSGIETVKTLFVDHKGTFEFTYTVIEGVDSFMVNPTGETENAVFDTLLNINEEGKLAEWQEYSNRILAASILLSEETEVPVYVGMYNPQNKQNVLVSAYDGDIIYDAEEDFLESETSVSSEETVEKTSNK